MDNVAVGHRVPDFVLKDQDEKAVSLKEILQKGPVLLAFYPGDFSIVCTKQLCNYRDNIAQFQKYGVQVAGVSKNPPKDHRKFAEEYHFQFPLFTDFDKSVAKLFGCTSLLMLGGISRAVFIISKSGYLLYRYVEPTIITHRKANELVEILENLKATGKI